MSCLRYTYKNWHPDTFSNKLLIPKWEAHVILPPVHKTLIFHDSKHLKCKKYENFLSVQAQRR